MNPLDPSADPVTGAIRKLIARLDAVETRLAQVENSVAAGAGAAPPPAPSGPPPVIVQANAAPRLPPVFWDEPHRHEPASPPPIAPEARPSSPYALPYGAARPSTLGAGGSPPQMIVAVGVPKVQP
jgi:hypothetical protein